MRGRAVHVAYDFWADWYEYAFPNLFEIPVGYPGALRENPRTYLLAVIRDIFGNPFSPIAIDPSWLTPTVTSLAQAIYEEQIFGRMPILADALEDAGCTNQDVLSHCRQSEGHVRGCFALDLLLRKE